MANSISESIKTHDFASFTSFNNDRPNRGSQSSTSSTTTTPSQEFSPSVMDTSLQSQSSTDQGRGRPRYKRHQPSRRYYTPPSRVPSPARPDFMLEVESAPQDPDIFADAETDYFSSTDKADAPRAFRRHFFDAVPSVDSQTAKDQPANQSIDAILASK